MELVPRWLIYQSNHGGGQRQVKRILLNPPEVAGKHQIIHSIGRKSKVIDAISNNQRIVMADKLMGFENWEYRFWSVEIKDSQPICSCCRMCGITLYNKEVRRKHLGEKGCSKILFAYGFLLKDMKCVVCDARTVNKCWGIPICQKGNCLDQFMHIESTPDSLDRAIELVNKGMRP